MKRRTLLRVLAVWGALAGSAATARQAHADGEHGAIMRFEFDGQLDTTFGSGGQVIADFPGTGREWLNTGVPTTVTTTNDRYLAAGMVRDASSSRLLIARYRTSNGALDTAWGTQGVVVHDVPGFAFDEIARIVIDSSNRIVASGRVSDANGRESFLITRFLANGQLDVSFNGTGRVIFNVTATSSDRPIFGLALDGSGRIVVAGFTLQAPGQHSTARSVVLRFNASGLFDPNFGTGGRVITQLPGTVASMLHDVAIDVMGRPVVTGFSRTTANGVSRATMARFTTAGVIDATFNGTGVRLASFPNRPGAANCNDVAIDMANNYTFSCHSQNPSNQALEITIVRLLPSGAFDNSFSGDGRLVTSLGSGANAIDNPVRALFPLNIFTPPLIVVGYQQAADGDSGNFVGVGYNADGSLATMWGDQGIVLEQMPGYGHSTFYDGFTLGDGKVAVFGWVEN